MLRTSALLATLALAACTTADNASLTLTNNGGVVQLILDRSDPNHQFGTLSATINGIALPAPQITPGGCSSDGAFFNGGDECHDADASYVLYPAGFSSDAADVTVTEGGETFHVVAPDFFTARAVTVQTALDKPLAAGGTLVVSDGVAGDQLEGSVSVHTSQSSCFSLSATGSGSLSFVLDATDFDSQCDTVAAGTVVAAQMDLEVLSAAAQTTCDGPDNLTCTTSEPELQQTVAIELEF
jgi:hypothetical protein